MLTCNSILNMNSKFKMKLELLSLILLINTVHSQPAARLDCIPKSFKENSFVCVCNSTYCDTIEQVDRDQADTQFQEYVTSRNKYRLDKFKHSFQVCKLIHQDAEIKTISLKLFKTVSE